LDDDLREDSSIPNINDLPLRAIVASKDNALSNAQRRVIEEMDEDRVNFAAFGSIVNGWD
jgi:hypothetical protein